MTSPSSSPGGDQPPQPGWWKASDGNWYPPESRPAQAPAAAQVGTRPPATPPGMSGCLKAFLIVAGIGLVLFIGVIAAFAFLIDRAGDRLEQVGEGFEAETALVDPDQPDALEKDEIAAIGESLQISGYTVTVNSVEFRQQVGEFETAGYLVANVTIENRDDRSQSYGSFEWRLQTPDRQVIHATATGADQLGSGNLAEGGSVTGDVVWEVGAARGEFFVIYKPDSYDASRAIWPARI